MSTQTGTRVAKVMPGFDGVTKPATFTVWTHALTGTYAQLTRIPEYLTTNTIEKRTLSVHLWDISDPSEARFLLCNCGNSSVHPAQSYPAQALEVSRLALASGWQVFAPTSPTPPSQASYTTMPPMQYAQMPVPPPAVNAMQPSQAAMIQAMANLQLAPQDPRLQDPRYIAWYQQYQQTIRAQAAASQQHAAHFPMYALSSSGTPINTSHGTVRTEARGIFVSGLNYKARTKDVEAEFRRAGEVTKCEVQKDTSTGKSKGNATIQYASAAEAQQAIRMFNGRTYMNMKLNVRGDKEATAVSPPPVQASRSGEPIIVNGSQVC